MPKHGPAGTLATATLRRPRLVKLVSACTLPLLLIVALQLRPPLALSTAPSNHAALQPDVEVVDNDPADPAARNPAHAPADAPSNTPANAPANTHAHAPARAPVNAPLEAPAYESAHGPANGPANGPEDSAVSAAALDTLAACLAANETLLVRRRDAGFGALVARSYRTNAAEPAAFAQPGCESGVQAAVRCARRAGVRLCARSGGHSFSGGSLCGGLVLDLSRLSTARFTGDQRGGGADGVVAVGPAATLGDLLTFVHKRQRWFGAGVCPGVGVGGYVLGGGHGPYDGLLGLACDSLASFRMVDASGRVVVASRDANAGLFWAGCGAGAGHFGVVTEMSLRTAPAAPFDAAAAFTLIWPTGRAGAVIAALARAKLVEARVWARAEIISSEIGSTHSDLFVYGACFDMPSSADGADGAGDVSDCAARLTKMEFFSVKDMHIKGMFRMRDGRDLSAYLNRGAQARGSREPAEVDAALTGWRYKEGGLGNNITQHSVFLTMGQSSTPNKEEAFWQAYANTCRIPDGSGVQFVGCQVNPFHVRRPAHAGDERRGAFAHRDADALTFSFVVGSSAAERDVVYKMMHEAVRPLVSGVYVNYPQLQLKETEYPRLYWGDRLPRLQQLKREWDPDSFFLQQQPIPVD